MTRLKWKRVCERADSDPNWVPRLLHFEKECWDTTTGAEKGWSMLVTQDYVYSAGKRFTRSEHRLHDLVDAMVFAERQQLELLYSIYGKLIIDLKLR